MREKKRRECTCTYMERKISGNKVSQSPFFSCGSGTGQDRAEDGSSSGVLISSASG